jgi:hypothetical protein
MQKQKKDDSASVEAQLDLSSAENYNYGTSILYKSGATQKFSLVANTTTVFSIMKKEFLDYLLTGKPLGNEYAIDSGHWVIIIWSEVASLQYGKEKITNT